MSVKDIQNCVAYSEQIKQDLVDSKRSDSEFWGFTKVDDQEHLIVPTFLNDSPGFKVLVALGVQLDCVVHTAGGLHAETFRKINQDEQFWKSLYLACQEDKLCPSLKMKKTEKENLRSAFIFLRIKNEFEHNPQLGLKYLKINHSFFMNDVEVGHRISKRGYIPNFDDLPYLKEYVNSYFTVEEKKDGTFKNFWRLIFEVLNRFPIQGDYLRSVLHNYLMSVDTLRQKHG